MGRTLQFLSHWIDQSRRQARSRTRVAACLAAAIFAVGSASAFADIIELRDGTKITGTISRRGDNMVITRADNKQQIVVPATDVVEVSLTSTLTPAELSELAWKKLQPDLAKAAKIEDMLPKLDKFAATHAGTPAGEKAQNALASYKQLISQDPVKFRGDWVPRAQIDVIVRAEIDQAKPALAAYKGGKLREALDICKEALKTRPQNPHVLTIAGLVSYRQNALLQAKEYFGKLVEVNEASLLGYNNLGVVSFQLNKVVEGIGYYGKALQVAPENRLLLDNISEALVAAAGVKSAPAYTNLVRQYNQAETLLEAKFAKDGLYRYGSTWVTQQQKDRIGANRTAVQNAMSTLETNYAQAVRSVDLLEAHIKIARDEYDAAANNYNFWSVQNTFSSVGPFGGVGTTFDTGAMARRDAAALDMERARRRIAMLEDQRIVAIDAIRRMKTEAEKLKTAWTAIDKEQYTGIQRIMDIGDDEVVPPPSAVAIPSEVALPQPARVLGPTPVDQIPQQSFAPAFNPILTPVFPGNVIGPVVVPGFPGFGGGGGGGGIPVNFRAPTLPAAGPSVPTAAPGIPTFSPAGPPTPPSLRK